MANNVKNINEITRQLNSINDDTTRIPARDNSGDLAFPISALWNRLVALLPSFIISAFNIRVGVSDSQEYYNANDTIAIALETKGSKEELITHVNTNYTNGDPHSIIENQELFRQSINVMSTQEVTQAISNVRTFNFIGYFGSIDPQTVSDIVLKVGNFWYDQDDFLEVVPQTQVTVQQWDGTTWQTQDSNNNIFQYPINNTQDIHMDVWSSTDTLSGYYWFNGWEQLDATGDGITIGANAQGKLGVIDGSIGHTQLDPNINLQGVRNIDYNTLMAMSDNLTDGNTYVTYNDPADGIVNIAFLPDYANIESINRISTNNGTWQADRDGFVNCHIVTNNASGLLSLIVNGITVKSTFAVYGSGGGGEIWTQTVPVKNNDVIQLKSEIGFLSGSYCYFIPPTPVLFPSVMTDAPDDGKMYARKNGQWVEIV